MEGDKPGDGDDGVEVGLDPERRRDRRLPDSLSAVGLERGLATGLDCPIVVDDTVSSNVV